MHSEGLANPYANQSLKKRLARRVLNNLHAILPGRAYQAIYEPAFRIYHARLRRSYARQLRNLSQLGDEELVQRAQRVHSVMPFSLVGSSGLEHTDRCASELIANHIPGAFVECGVARGGSAALLAQVARLDDPHRQCWFFDSFAGLPDPTAADLESGATGDHIRPLPKGSCLGTIEQVSSLLFEHFEFSPADIRLVKGWFQDTLPLERAAIGPISLLRIDGDWYDSTMCCLSQLFDQVSPRGIVIVDDYWSCNGARKATNDFLTERRLEVELVPDGRGGVSFTKPVAAATPVGLV